MLRAGKERITGVFPLRPPHFRPWISDSSVVVWEVAVSPLFTISSKSVAI